MATLHSIQSGNFTDASTWGVVDVTSFQESRFTIQSLTTTQTNSTTVFTPGAITIDGVSIQIGGMVNNPTGTMTVRLYNNTDSLTVQDVTINCSDLVSTAGATIGLIGWTYFKFPSSITLVAGKQYSVRCFASVNSQVGVYRSSTSNDWSRCLVTNTTQAPASSDNLLISGEFTSSGTNATYTVTMDNTTTTMFGNLYVCSKGVLNYGTNASTNYKLKCAGNIIIGVDGALNQGTSGTPIPSSSSATLEINCISALQYQFHIYGTYNAVGASIAHFKTKLANDVSISATTSTTTDTTGWLSGDTIVVASTSRTYTEAESLVLNSNSTGTTLTHPAYLFAHGGNAATYVQADVVNITRNVSFFSSTPTFRTNIQLNPKAKINWKYARFYDIGTGAAVTNVGIGQVTTWVDATLDIQYSVFMNTVSNGNSMFFLTNGGIFTSTISNNVFYALGSVATTNFIPVINDNNIFIRNLGTTATLAGGSFSVPALIGSGNIFTSNQNSQILNFANNASNNSFYSNGGFGISFTPDGVNNQNISNLLVWRNNGGAITLNASTANQRNHITSFSNVRLFGNIGGINYGTRTNMKVLFENSYFYGGSTFIQPNMFGASGLPIDAIYFNNCYFGYSDSSLTASNFGVTIFANSTNGTSLNFNNCYFGGVENSPVYGNPVTNLNCIPISLNHNGVIGSYRQWLGNGVVSSDSSIFNTLSPSIRITPSTALFKSHSNIFKVPVASGTTVSVSIDVRKSSVDDGTAYSGNEPRLMLAFNPNCGITAETVCNTMTLANGNWETLTFTSPIVPNDCVMDFYVDCDGTNGWINVDNWLNNSSIDTKGFKYWSAFGSYVESQNSIGTNNTKAFTFLM